MNDYLQVKELYHHGIKGQKWGVRRFQNEDGSLTKKGQLRYNAWVHDEKVNNDPILKSSMKKYEEAAKKLDDFYEKNGDLDSFVEDHPNDDSALKKWEQEELELLKERQNADDMYKAQLEKITASYNNAEKLINSGKTVYTKISNKALNDIMKDEDEYNKKKNEYYGGIVLKTLGAVSIGALGAVGLAALTGVLSK